MTVFSTGTNRHRFPLPTTTDDSITDTEISNNTTPRHAALCCLPRRYERRFSSNKQFPAPEATARTALMMLPHLDDDENDDASTVSRSAIPSLTLKPRPKSHAGRHKTHKKSTLRLHKPSSHADKAIITPISTKLPPKNVLQPLGERSESTTNQLIVGKSLMRRKNHIDHSRTIGKRAMKTIGANRTDSWYKTSSKLTLRSRFERSTLPSSPSINNKENQARRELPYYLFLA
jgi:hypothetical protein